MGCVLSFLAGLSPLCIQLLVLFLRFTLHGWRLVQLPERFSSPLSYADPVLLGSACDCAFLLFRLSLFLNFKNKDCGYTGFSDYAGAS